jgi:nucleotide-binding universal stress UspA family protein
LSSKTLIGYDSEHGGADALALGRRLAHLIAGGIEVVTVLPWPSHLAGHDDLQRQVDDELAESFAAIREELDGLEVATRGVAHHSAAQVLSALAESEEVGLIVLASSHRGPLGRTLLGSVGESLAHGAPCAVAIAPRGYGQDDDAELARIGIAYDGSEEADAALATATAIAASAHGELTVLTVADYPRYTRAAAWSLLSEGEIHDREHDDKRGLVDAAVSSTPEAVVAEGRVLTGDTARQLAEASADFDLIVAGSRSYGPLRRTLLGSATRRLLSDSACPVLVLPRGAEPLL